MTDGPTLVPLGARRPEVARDAWLAPGVVVAGDVTVEPEASLWYGVVIRAEVAPVRIGAGSNLQDNVVVHVDPGTTVDVQPRVAVGHNATLHGCRIGSGTVVGMGAQILNNADIGEDCLIAAGAVVPQGTVIPPRSLVAGVPGKVRRELTDDEVALNHANVRLYLDLARQHQDGLAE